MARNRQKSAAKLFDAARIAIHQKKAESAQTSPEKPSEPITVESLLARILELESRVWKLEGEAKDKETE